MDKKGFTLVELLASIVILAIVTTLAVSGYGKISKSMKEKSRENTIEYIEVKAADYANDTGNLVTNVDNLVKEGYIEADDKEGHVIDPVDGSYMNCLVINVKKENENYFSQITDKEECDTTKLILKNSDIEVRIYKTEDNETKGEEIEKGNWSNQNVCD